MFHPSTLQASCPLAAQSLYNGAAGLQVEDILTTLARAAYNEELDRRERSLIDLKRKRYDEEQKRKKTYVRQYEEEDIYQIQLLKEVPSRQNFKSYQIHYFKQNGTVLLRIESSEDNFVKSYHFKASEIDERLINYKIHGGRIMSINVPKRRQPRGATLFEFLQQKHEATMKTQRELALKREEQRQQETLRREKERQAALQKEQARQAARKAALRREQERQQDRLRQLLNLFVQDNEAPQKNTAVTVPVVSINETEQVPLYTRGSEDESDFDYEVDIDEDADLSSTDDALTPEASDVEESEIYEDAADPEVSDIDSYLDQFAESNVIKKPSSLIDDVESDVVSSEEASDSESISKKRKVRSPSIEEVEDEEFSRWRSY